MSWAVAGAERAEAEPDAPSGTGRQPRLATVMYCLLESQRLAYCLLTSFMPATAAKALGYLGCPTQPAAADLSWGRLAAGTLITKAEPLFPRIDEKEA